MIHTYILRKIRWRNMQIVASAILFLTSYSVYVGEGGGTAIVVFDVSQCSLIEMKFIKYRFLSHQTRLIRFPTSLFTAYISLDYNTCKNPLS